MAWKWLEKLEIEWKPAVVLSKWGNHLLIDWSIDLLVYLFIYSFIYLFIYSFIINHNCTRYILHILLGHPSGTHLLILNLKELRDSDSVISLGTKSHIFGPR